MPAGHAGEVVGVGGDHLFRRGDDARLGHLGHLRDRVHQQTENPLPHLHHHHAGRRGRLGGREPQPRAQVHDREDAAPQVGDAAHVGRRLGHAGDVGDPDDLAHLRHGNPELFPVERERQQVELGSGRRRDVSAAARASMASAKPSRAFRALTLFNRHGALPRECGPRPRCRPRGRRPGSWCRTRRRAAPVPDRAPFTTTSWCPIEPVHQQRAALASGRHDHVEPARPPDARRAGTQHRAAVRHVDEVAPPVGDAAVVDLADRLGLRPHRLRHVRQRDGVALLIDLDDERADDRERHRQAEREGRALAPHGLDVDGAAERVDGPGHHVEARRHGPPAWRRGRPSRGPAGRSGSGAHGVLTALRPGPSASAFLRMACSSSPRPSSATRITTRPDWGDASSRSVPSSGLPARARSSGDSMPCTIALVTRWSSGSPSRSSTALSSGVSPPDCSSRTRFPSAWAGVADHPGKAAEHRRDRQQAGLHQRRLEPLERLLERDHGLVQPGQLLAGAAPARERAVGLGQRRVLDQPFAQHLEQHVETAEVHPHHGVHRVGPRRATPPPVGAAPLGLGVRRAARRPRPATRAPARRIAPTAPDPARATRGARDPPACPPPSTSSPAGRVGPPARHRGRSSPHASSSAWAISRIGARPIMAELPFTVCSRPDSEASSSSAGSPSRQRRSSSTKASVTCSASGRHSRT